MNTEYVIRDGSGNVGRGSTPMAAAEAVDAKRPEHAGPPERIAEMLQDRDIGDLETAGDINVTRVHRT